MAAAPSRRPTLIVDNFDSYTHNLYQMCWSASGTQPIVIRNNEGELFQALRDQQAFDSIIISPGPGSPDNLADFGICADILKAPPAPVFGVCLGCQGIGSLYGMDVRRAPGGAVHGRTSAVFHNEAERGGGGLFAGIPSGFKVVRYHSLAICARSPGEAFPEHLELTAWTEDGVVMGLQHRKLPLWGVQFHPESICTEYGAELLSNFIALADAHNAAQDSQRSNASTPPSRVSHAWLRDDVLANLSRSSSSSSSGSALARLRASPVSQCSCNTTSDRRWPTELKHEKLKLVHKSIPCRLEAETYYMARLASDARSFWLDSSRRERGMARFSYMGGSDGPLSFQVRYNLLERTLDTTHSDGREEKVRDCDVLDYLDKKMMACKLAALAGAERLPFEFMGGFVGYLGYELKELCEDGVGWKNRHVSEEPDAVLLFSDRFLVWDHQEGSVHAVALVREEDECQNTHASQWLDSTLLELNRLASLPFGDMLAERHKALTKVAAAESRRAGVVDFLDFPAATTDHGTADLGRERGLERAPHAQSSRGASAVDSPSVQFGALMGEERTGGDEPPTVDADAGEEPEPSHTPSGPGSLSFPPVKPTAPSLATGPGSVPRGAMPQSDGSCDDSKRVDTDRCRSEEPGFVSIDTMEQYQAKVRECLGYILEGESYELCLTTRHRSRCSMLVDPLRFYQRLRAVNPAPYSAMLRCGKGLTVCSSSPERFLRIDADGLCDSKPIKGTRRRGACAQEDADICSELRCCEKDLAENLMIVDLVRNDLGRVCTEASVCCPKLMDVETYATVHQLVSTIQGQKRAELSSVDVFRATFPMGSMTGAPKRRSLALLDALEADARGIYSGAIGFFSLNGAIHFSVAIRTAVVTDQGVKVGAGGAITVLSDPQDEWDEMELKASALLSCAKAVATPRAASSCHGAACRVGCDGEASY